MKTTWHGLIGFLVLCLLISACGKDNKTNEQQPGANNPVINTPVNTNGVVTATTWEDFKSKVSAGSFANPTFTNIEYIYSQCSSEQSKFLGIFNFTSTSCSGNFSRSMNNGQVIREDGLNSKAAVISHLNSLTAQVTSSLYYRQLSPTAYQFQVGSTIYVINLAYPAEANPTYKTSVSSGSGYQLVQYISHGF